ncbi:MAG: hypothetical protein ABSF99_10230 [Anaerolineales bacterium]|jgi:sulfur transfer complex TusBCD TusB component (DsrH family)
MKIKAGTVINRYNGKPVMIEQDVYLQDNGQPLIVNGMPHMTAGREMTVGDVFSTILSSKKVEQFNVLKADVLARRFYQADLVDIDESDYSSLVEIIDKNDQFVPFVLAYAKRALIEAKEGSGCPGISQGRCQ